MCIALLNSLPYTYHLPLIKPLPLKQSPFYKVEGGDASIVLSFFGWSLENMFQIDEWIADFQDVCGWILWRNQIGCQ